MHMVETTKCSEKSEKNDEREKGWESAKAVRYMQAWCTTVWSNAVLRWGRGQLPPNLNLAPKCDMKHCLTNSKHQRIGAKNVLWPSKYAKMRFRPWLCLEPAGGAHDAPSDPRVSWEGNTPPPISLHLISLVLRRSPLGPSICLHLKSHLIAQLTIN